MAVWADKRKSEHRAAQALSIVESRTQVGADGTLRWTGWSNDVDTAIDILASATSYHPEVSEQFRRSISRRAGHECKRNGTMQARDYLQEATRLEKEYLRQPQQQYVLLTAASVLPTRKLTRIRDGQLTIRFRATPPGNFKRPAQLDSAERLPLLAPGSTFVTVDVKSREPHGAIDTAIDRLDFLRALWNFYYNHKRARMTFGASAFHVKPVNVIMLGPVHTLHHPTGESVVDGYWYDPNYSDMIVPKSIDGEYSDLRKFDQSLRARVQRSPIRPFLESLWIRLARALDERNLQAAFLKLWSVLEVATCSSEESHDITVRRAAFLWKDAQYATLVLDYMRDWRNRIVHEGTEADDAERLTYRLKRYVEELVMFLTWNAHRFESMGDVREVFDLPKSPGDLRRRIRQYKFALALRGS